MVIAACSIIIKNPPPTAKKKRKKEKDNLEASLAKIANLTPKNVLVPNQHLINGKLIEVNFVNYNSCSTTIELILKLLVFLLQHFDLAFYRLLRVYNKLGKTEGVLLL